MKRWHKVLLGGILLCVGLYAGAGFMLARGKVIEERHRPFAHAPFDYSSASYADYLAWARALVTAARTDNPTPEVIANLAPFELVPGPQCPRDADGKVAMGIVLAHGLFESAYSMRPLGAALSARCLHVYGLLLPGHGTRPGDQLTSSWQDWAALVRFATARMAEQANTVLLGGHSAGGTLALLEAHTTAQADALILFAPALAIAPAAKYARFVAPLGRLFAGAAWLGVEADEALYRYESLTFGAAAEMYALMMRTHAVMAAQRRQLPVFTVASQEDETVGVDAILAYMATNSHPLSRTLLYSRHPVTPARGVTVVDSNLSQQDILSLSHLGLMIPPTDPYFGRDGAYRNCGHYGNAGNPLFVACKKGERTFYGETTGENRAQAQVLERIAFNPLYDGLLAGLDEFLAALGQ